MKDYRARGKRKLNNHKKIIFRRKLKRVLRVICRCLITLMGWVGVISTPMLMAAVLLFG